MTNIFNRFRKEEDYQEEYVKENNKVTLSEISEPRFHFSGLSQILLFVTIGCGIGYIFFGMKWAFYPLIVFGVMYILVKK